MLSLSPRFDLFDFCIPKSFIPDELIVKYDGIVSQVSPSVFTNTIDYLNESIQGISIPGMSDLNIFQPQVSRNSGTPHEGYLNIEPHHENSYLSAENPLMKIEKQLTVTFRQNQGLINYYLLYETAFHRYCRPQLYSTNETFILYLKNESGKYISQIKFYQPEINSIDGLEFSFNKIERAQETFSVSFTFNNIDFDFLYQEKDSQ